MSAAVPSFFRFHLAPILPHADDPCSCQDAKRGCAPSYVFSISGQVSFRRTLLHLVSCTSTTCSSLITSVQNSITTKLSWLFQEATLIGCVHIQPYLYGQKSIAFHDKNFSLVASHLAQCPKQSCAQLRRCLLLAIRRDLSPALTAKTHQVTDETEPE